MIDNEYRLALFGIESPGGFQTWDAVGGSAERHNWLPGGVSVRVDAYGDLAPQPAVSRLFVPYERSHQIRAAITRAFLQHAHQLWKSHPNSEDWTTWFIDFLASWKSSEVEIAMDHTALLNLREELVKEPLSATLRSMLWSFLCSAHSKLGHLISTRDPNSWFTTFRDLSEPVPSDHLQKAAAKANIPTNQIGTAVSSLSALLGWDITQGRSQNQ